MRITKVSSQFNITVELVTPEGSHVYVKPCEGLEAELDPGENEEDVRKKLYARCRWHAYRHISTMLKDAERLIVAEEPMEVINKVAGSAMPSFDK